VLKVSPAENFEKILINLSFKECSISYKNDLIEFCKKYKLSSGLIYLCLSTYGIEGPVVAL